MLLGHGVTLLGAAALLVGAALVWLFVAGYGLTFSGLWPLLGQRGTAAGVVESSGPVALWTGEPAGRTTAIFSHQGQTYRAVGYGEAGLEPGQPARVVFPRNNPSQAWVEGLQRFPLRLRGLANLAGMALCPALLLCGVGVFLGARQRSLVISGSEVQGRRTRHIGLARPFSELFLDRFEWNQDGRVRGHWSVGGDGLEEALLLASPRGAVVVPRLLPGWELQGEALRGVSAGRKLRAWLVLALVASQVGAFLLFLLT